MGDTIMDKLESVGKLRQALKEQIVEEVLDILRDEIDENFTDEFLGRAVQAELRAREGAVSRYTAEEFSKKFL